MSSITAKFLLLFNTFVFLLSINAASAVTINLGVDYDVPVPVGFYVGVLIHEWPPHSDYISHDLGAEKCLNLDRYEVGTYFFSAQWVIYASDGSIATYADGSLAISEESELAQYDIVAADEHEPPDVFDPLPSAPGSSAVHDSRNPENGAVNTPDPQKLYSNPTSRGVGIPTFPKACFICVTSEGF